MTNKGKVCQKFIFWKYLAVEEKHHRGPIFDRGAMARGPAIRIENSCRGRKFFVVTEEIEWGEVVNFTEIYFCFTNANNIKSVAINVGEYALNVVDIYSFWKLSESDKTTGIIDDRLIIMKAFQPK